MRAIASGLFILAVALITSVLSLEHTYKRASHDVCKLVDQYYYRNQEKIVRQFVDLCYQTAENQTFIFSKAANIARINARLSYLKTSHLAVYDPDENRMMWENQGLDTGIRSRLIDDQLVTYDVIPKSPAERTGLKAGDVILKMNGQHIISPYDAQAGRGIFYVRRGEKEFSVRLIPEVVAEPMSAHLEVDADGVGVLRIPSFLSQYFEFEEWAGLAARIVARDDLGKPMVKKLIIDLRDNAGGSFPAMLRALSPFRCDDPYIGRIFRQSAGEAREAELRDNLDSQSQLEQLGEASVVRLRAFSRYGCYQGPVVVLIDNGTNSVAEIFAQSFLTRPNSDVLGQSSGGQVVMARWLPIEALGSESYQISIPIAGYATANGIDLENRGVQPRHLLYYDLINSLQGRDSWLVEAKARLRQMKSVSK